MTNFGDMFEYTALDPQFSSGNDCLKSDIYVSWGVLQSNPAFAETYSAWAPAVLPASDACLRPTDFCSGTCDAGRRLSYEAPADAKVAALEAKNIELEAKNTALEEKVAALEAKMMSMAA